jgi:hypothetical protein
MLEKIKGQPASHARRSRSYGRLLASAGVNQLMPIVIPYLINERLGWRGQSSFVDFSLPRPESSFARLGFLSHCQRFKKVEENLTLTARQDPTVFDEC